MANNNTKTTQTFPKDFYKKLDSARNDTDKKNDEKSTMHKKFIADLKEDNDAYLDMYYCVILDRLIFKCSRLDDNIDKEITLWNIKNIINEDSIDKKTKIKITTFWTGFFDAKTKKFNTSYWDELEIPLMYEQLKNKFLNDGIQMEDISNMEKSYNQVIKFTIPARAI
jgi:hypothetical protein